MATKTRIYMVEPKTADGTPAPLDVCRIVRASHPAHALKHVADGAYTVKVADQEELVAMLDAGRRPEDIGQEQQEIPTT